MAGKRRSKGLKGSKTAEGERMPIVSNTAAMALSIPELLSNVFSFSACGDTELAISARVCKTWTDPALDELWRAIDSIFPLMELVVDLDSFNMAREDPETLEIQQAFGTLQKRKLRLKTFLFSASVIGESSEAALALWLKDMDRLEEIVLPPYYITARILNSIKTLPQLQIIRQIIDSKYQDSDTGMLGTLPSGSFPSLVELTFTATPTAARHLLFNSTTSFTSLTTLHLHATKDIKADQVLAFTQQLAAHCPTITSIELALFLGPAFRDQGASVLPIGILESLYPCKHLNDLKINHPLPLKLNGADVENMAHAWPQISHLCLCSDPNFSFPVTEQMGNSLSILSVFALHLPYLITLGLYFNGEDRVTFGGYLYPRCQFTQLRSLIVGLSPDPKTHTRDLGFYLASLCSEPVSVSWGIRGWMPKRMPPDAAECEKAWRDVKEVMAFAMRVKLAEEC
ncbi:hypothetical protein FRC00_010339 [Tulasnella sp. 408]|nr:hypothetical protein FRC00_010339 [Tulasnella sp. 408]